MKNPIWIMVDDGDMFEGHQIHWANCFFSNAYQSAIEGACEEGGIFSQQVKLVIREMTDDEVRRMPEAVAFRDWLIEEYGEC